MSRPYRKREHALYNFLSVYTLLLEKIPMLNLDYKKYGKGTQKARKKYVLGL